MNSYAAQSAGLPGGRDVPVRRVIRNPVPREGRRAFYKGGCSVIEEGEFPFFSEMGGGRKAPRLRRPGRKEKGNLRRNLNFKTEKKREKV